MRRKGRERVHITEGPLLSANAVKSVKSAARSVQRAGSFTLLPAAFFMLKSAAHYSEAVY